MSSSKKRNVINGDLDSDDEDFKAFMGESMSSEDSTLDTGRIARYLDSPKRKPSNLYDISDDDDDDKDDDESDGGLMGTGKMFLKKKTTEAEKPKPAKRTPEPSARNAANKFIKNVQDQSGIGDSLEDESLNSFRKDRGMNGISMNGMDMGDLNLNLGTSNSVSGTDTMTGQGIQRTEPNHISLKAGRDTLDEMTEKQRFFAALEKEQGDKTVDYSALNRMLDQQETLAGATLNMADDLPEEEEEEMSVSEEPAPKFTENEHNGTEPQGGMLDRVALMDSMGSSYDSKPTASRDRGLRDMHTIPESQSDSGRHEDSDGGLDEPDAIIFQPSEHTDTHGVTIKTQTGFGDTSREMAKQYQNAIGLATADGEFTLKEDTSTLAGKSSMFNTQKTHMADTLGSDRNQDTPEFALKPVMNKERKDERTADDLLKQAKEFKRPDERPSVHFKFPSDEGESDGFDITPRKVHLDRTEEPSALDLSPIAKHPQDSFLKSQFETSQGLDSSAHQESTPIATSKVKQKAKERYAHIRSSGYGQKHPTKSSMKKSTDVSVLQGSQTDEVRPPLTDSTESMRKKKASVASMLISNKQRSCVSGSGVGGIIHNDKLMSSIASLVHQLQSEMTSRADTRPARAPNSSEPEAKWSVDGPVLSSSQRVAVMEREQNMVRDVRQWQEQYEQERKLHNKLKVDCDAQERHYKRQLEQLKVDHEQELFKLKQENFVLTAKLAEDIDSRKPAAEDANNDESEKVKLMEKEIREQEKLLAGYQQENERIYQELKSLQKSSKETETKMFKENQRLQNEIEKLKEDISRKDLELRNKGLITSPAVQQQIAGGHMAGSAALGANRIAQLEGQLQTARRQEELLYAEIETHKEAKREVENQMEALMRQLGDMDTRIKTVKTLQNKQQNSRVSELEKEIEKLQKKVRWYAENQDLLDKDKRVILAKDDEIKRLRTKLNGLSTESGRRASEMRAKTKERSMDAKRIQDLERQVKEMENILKKRHPDSIPMMIWAANHLPEQGDSAHQNKPASVQFLESRIAKLEKELDEKDEEGKKDIRVLEQKYSLMKLQYEERINDLEDRLTKYERPGDQNLKEGQRPHSSALAIQRELDSVRERHKKEAQDLRAEIDKLKKENTSLKNKEAASSRLETRTVREKESDAERRVKSLEQEVSDKERDKQFLKITIDRLQKEKQQLLTENVRNVSRLGGGDRKTGRERGRPKSAESARTRSRSESRTRPSRAEQPLPPFTDDYIRDRYEPDAFAGQHVSDILQENQELKLKVERLQFESEQQRVNLSKVLAESENRERRLRETSEEQLTALKIAHHNDVQRVYAESAVNYSTSKMAELTSKVDTQEVAIKFLKDQLKVARTDSEQLAALKIRESTLETQVKQLTEELREAKQTQTPEMRHFHSLTEKISQLESRHVTRERELQQIIQQTRLSANADFTEEVERWKRIVETKNKEIEHFKTELDSILEVLKELQRQGVLLPYNKQGIDGYPAR